MAENQVKVSQIDNVPNWLASKIQGGYGIILTNNGTCLRIDCSGTGPNGMVAVDSQDKNLGFLSSKISSGTGISISNIGSALEISANTQTGDHKIIVDSLDTNPDYLLNKLTAGSNVSLTNTGSAIQVSATDTIWPDPMTTEGDIVYENSSLQPARLGIGTNGQVLTVDSGIPSWQNIPTQTGDHKVLATSADTSPNYLDQKIAGSGVVAVTDNTTSLSVGITPSITDGQVLTTDNGDVAWKTIPTQTGDHKVLVDSSDTNPQYLGLKLKSGAGVNISYYNHDKMEIAALGQVKVNLLGTMDYLENKLIQGSGITLTKTNNDITIAADTQTGDHKTIVDVSDTSPGYLASKLTAGSNITITNNGTDLEISATDVGFANPMTDVGDLIIGGSSGAPTRLAKGYQGQVLKVGASSLEWSADTGFANPMEEQGDLIVGSYDGVASRLPIGTANQFLISNGTTAEWATLPLNIDWFVNPGLANGEFNQSIDRTFYVRMYPSLQMRAINHVAILLSAAVAADVFRVAVYDNTRTMVAYGESTGSSGTFRRVTLTQLQPWTPGTNDLYYLGVSIHASSNSSTKFKTASVTGPSYCWYEDVALTSGRAMPAPSSLTASGSKVPIIGLRGR